MVKTVEDIEKQIEALQKKKKALREKEMKADKQALSEAYSFYGKLLLVSIELDWKEINPELLGNYIIERKDKIREICAGEKLSRHDALERIRSFKKGNRN